MLWTYSPSVSHHMRLNHSTPIPSVAPHMMLIGQVDKIDFWVILLIARIQLSCKVKIKTQWLPKGGENNRLTMWDIQQLAEAHKSRTCAMNDRHTFTQDWDKLWYHTFDQTVVLGRPDCMSHSNPMNNNYLGMICPLLYTICQKSGALIQHVFVEGWAYSGRTCQRIWSYQSWPEFDWIPELQTESFIGLQRVFSCC